MEKVLLIVIKKNGRLLSNFLLSLFLAFVFATNAFAQLSIISAGTPFTQDFTSLGSSGTATLPAGFVVTGSTTFSSGLNVTTQAAGTTGTGGLTSTSSGGAYNFANGITATSTDRCLGFLSSSGYTSPCSIMLQVTNNTGSMIVSFSISFDYEKYRSGSRAFDWTFFHGNDGSSWASNSGGDQAYVADATNNTVYNPPTTISKTVTITGIAVPDGSSYYFRWTYTGNGGSTNGQAIGIDNLSITATTGTIPTSNYSDYFRSKQSGDWGSASTWESSADGITWINATLSPTSAANTITIKNGHTVSIVAATSADQLTIEAGAILNHAEGIDFTLDDGLGSDLVIYGTYILNGTIPVIPSPQMYNITVESGGVVQVKTNSTPYLDSDNFAFSTNTTCLFKTGSVFDWSVSSIFQSSGITYFANSTEKPIFKISANLGTVGAGTTTTINGLLQVDGAVTFDNSGIKIFRDGIVGSGSISQLAGSGALQINGTSAQLGGSGTITLNGSGLQIISPAIVSLISNKIINGTGTFSVNNGSTFNCFANVVSGSSAFMLNAGGKLGIGSPDGITSSGLGNIQTSGRTYSSDANYVYNGITNQVTGNFTTTPVANTVYTLTVANTGNTVTLTNDNTTATALYLNSGYFASGTNQTLKIANNGIVYGNGGSNPNSANAGNIEFINAGSTSGIADGYPKLYSVIINGGVDFNGAITNSATIMNQMKLNSGAYIIDAPYYNSGSSLVYSTGGSYQRNIEWGNSAGLPGYPYNVTVQANTILDLNSNPITISQLETGGDLILGNSTGWGRVYMNNNMNKPLSVGGNLIIGSVDAASTSSELGLSNVMNGDLWLYGNFSRYNGSSYTDNNRAIYFKGALNSTINTPNVSITPTVPTQYFSYAVIDKTNGTEQITLNCPVGISKLIIFSKGIVTSSASNPLVVVDNADATGASTSSFVNGPVKKIGDDNFSFPVGKLVFTTPHYRAIGISGLAADPANAFTAEFMRANARLLGAVNSPGPPPLQWVSQCEYWKLDHNTGSSSANVTLSWSGQSPCNQAYVTDPAYLVIAHFDNSTNSWNSHGNNGGYTGDNTAGTVTWNGVPSFSPFSLGTTDVRYNPLPQVLSLFSFSAVSRKSDVLIEWSIMNNNDQDEYVIEHSRDGIKFETKKVVPSKTILNQASYSEVDSKPYFGWNYYRIQATDKQNREKISQVVKVWYGIGEYVRISPNPASEKIVINFSDPRSISRIDLVNISGQVLKQVNTIQFSTEINISQLQAGMYYLRILDKNGLITKPFVKK